MRTEQQLFLAWREHRLLNAINHVVFELDHAGNWTFVNRAWTALSGYTMGEAIGSHICDVLDPDDAEIGEGLLERVRAGESVQAIVRLIRSDGEVRRVNMEIAPAPSLNGTAMAMAGSFSQVVAYDDVRISVRREHEEKDAQPDRRVTFTIEAAREFASEKPLDEIYHWFVNSLSETFDYHQVQLYSYDRTTETSLLVASSADGGLDPAGAHGHAISSNGAVDEAIRKTTTIVHSTGPMSDEGVETTSGSESHEVAAPIMLGQKLLGVVAVYRDGKECPGVGDIALLEGLSGLLASTIDREQLRQQMEERLAELDNLQRLTRREAWLSMPDATTRGVRGYRYDRRRMDAIESADDSDETGSKDTEMVNKAKNVVRSTPLQVRGQVFGLLGIEDEPENPLTQDELALLEAISTQVSEAMENARLLEQTQKRAVELETVSRVSTATSTILEKDKLLQGVVELTKRSFNLYHAHVYLLDAERGELVLAAGSGEAGRQMVEDGWHIDLDEPRSIVAQAARARKGIIVNDVRKETGFLPNPLLPHTRSELAIPMISGNRLLGVLDVQSDRIDAFTEDDVRIQSALAGQVATALQNATLYQEQLETAEKLREFDRLKSEFLASMSHELRTPLNSIIGFSDVLLEGIDGELNERMREDVQLIRNSGQHLRELIGDILDMSKIEAGMMGLRYEKIDVHGLRHEIEGFARTQLMAYDKVLDFRMQVGPEVDAIEADLTRFKQVLFNLVSNAIKFTEEGTVTLSMSVEDDKLLVEVEDTGIGITKDDIPIVFEQFRQVDGSLTRSAGGTGLGLSISKSLVELHGGEIWVESVIGEGTTFYFTLPLDRERPRRQPVEHDVPAKSGQNGVDG